MEVTVTFTDKTIGLARLDHGFFYLKLPLTPLFQMTQLLSLIRILQDRHYVRKIFHNPVMYIVWLTVLRSGTCNRSPGMHARNEPGNVIDVVRGNATTGRHAAQQILLGKLTHPDGVFNRATFPMQLRMLRVTLHGNDIKVEIGGKPPVQPYFFPAVEVAFLQRRKIKKAEIDGFLDFVDELAGQNYPRDVRLDQADVTYRMVI
jgi:hypothetical protein